MRQTGVIIAVFLLVSCAGVPKSITPVTNFELSKYLGKWYEIARLDHSFERGLEKVTATYSINEDGSVRVENSGFSSSKNKWKNATGRAKFSGDTNTGYLKVSFFGPFYGDYVIFSLDKEAYQYAFVTGSANTLWLLSRTPDVTDNLIEEFVRIAQDAGYETENLIFVNQD